MAQNGCICNFSRFGIYKYLQKPWDEDMLRDTIQEAYEVYRLQKEKNELTRSLLRVNKQLEFMLRQKLIS